MSIKLQETKSYLNVLNLIIFVMPSKGISIICPSKTIILIRPTQSKRNFLLFIHFIINNCYNSTCHAQKLEDPYAEIYRTLKPGGYFACYEWLTTEKYDESNPKHKSIMLGLEVRNAI